MSQETGADGRADRILEQFEKNQFFQGKLMTARDMQTEQDYHTERIHALNRFSTGQGILYGAEVSSVEETETELKVTVEPGIVLDAHGRPIIIEHSTTRTLPLPSDDVIYLFIRFDTNELESVPVPEVRGASSEEYMSNRVVEDFEVTYQESPPEEFETLPEIDTSIDDDTEAESFLRTLANRYHQQNRMELQPVEDPSIFVGSFERTRDGSWVKGADTVKRSLVYDNDMLYSMLVSHITETDRPHNMAGGMAEDISVDLEELVEVGEQLDTIRNQLDSLNRYVMRKTLKDEIRFFSTLATRFEEHDPEGSRLAQEIVEQAEAGMADRVYDDPEEYRSQVGQKLETHLELVEVLEASASEESLERYVEAVNELQTALAEDADIVRVAEVQDGVCEAADSLEELYGVVKE
ncbi:hypothetical protein BRC65_04625 [Halobacteriales archaeon QH_2_65_14]|nr:MAG: hypothetical protein BRC65_04625 [Halobacteriales archaeon QH_2_65_14]